MFVIVKINNKDINNNHYVIDTVTVSFITALEKVCFNSPGDRTLHGENLIKFWFL